LLVIVADNGTPVLYDSLWIALKVYYVNTRPEILDALGHYTNTLKDTTLENVPVQICLNTFDYANDSIKILSLQSLGGNTLIGIPDDHLCFVATPNTGFYGNDSIKIIIGDNGKPTMYDTVVIYLHVRHINRPPVIIDNNNNPVDTLYVDAYENEPLHLCLNITDPDNDQVNISNINGNASISKADNTCLDYTPHNDFIGTDRLLVRVCDNGVPSLSDSVYIIIHVMPKLIFSQAISPNGDLIEDEWLIGGIERYPNNTVTIFSRWGDVVYKVKGYDNINIVWKGKFNTGKQSTNNEAPDGTYFFIVMLEDGTKLTGFIVLKR